MAAIHGKRGSGLFSGLTFEMSSFTINATADTADASVMNSAAVTSATHWKTYVAGFKDWTATAEVLEPVAGVGIAALGGSASSLTLDAVDGLAYSGNAICTGISPSVDIGDAGRCTLTFQGTGQLSAA